MILFLAGPVFGELTEFCDNIVNTEAQLGLKADYVLQVGDLCGHIPVPTPTVFVSGKHDNHRWLRSQAARGNLEMASNLNWLINGYLTDLDGVSVVGLGKVWSPTSYNHQKLHRNRDSHYTREEVATAMSHDSCDILLTHEAACGARVGAHQSEAKGIDLVCAKLKPKLMVHGHYNHSLLYTGPTGTPTISLAKKEILPIDYSDNKFIILK